MLFLDARDGDAQIATQCEKAVRYYTTKQPTLWDVLVYGNLRPTIQERISYAQLKGIGQWLTDVCRGSAKIYEVVNTRYSSNREQIVHKR